MPREIVIAEEDEWKLLNPPLADENSKLKINQTGVGNLFRGLILQNGQIISAKHLICDADYVPQWTTSGSNSVFRTVLISTCGLSMSTGLFIIPPGLTINPVQIIQHDESTDICKGTCILIIYYHINLDLLYLTTLNTEHAKTDIDKIVDFFYTNSSNPDNKPKLLYRAEWVQHQRIAKTPNNVWVCDDPSFEVDIDSVKSVFKIFNFKLKFLG